MYSVNFTFNISNISLKINKNITFIAYKDFSKTFLRFFLHFFKTFQNFFVSPQNILDTLLNIFINFTEMEQLPKKYGALTIFFKSLSFSENLLSWIKISTIGSKFLNFF